MSIQRCDECGKLEDTDFFVGTWDEPGRDYICELCWVNRPEDFIEEPTQEMLEDIRSAGF